MAEDTGRGAGLHHITHGFGRKGLTGSGRRNGLLLITAWCFSREAEETEPKSVAGFWGLENMWEVCRSFDTMAASGQRARSGR